MNSNFKNPAKEKVVQCEPRPLHAFFVDADDSLKNSEVGQIMCLNFESARVTLLRHQFAGGKPEVKALSIDSLPKSDGINKECL